MKDVQSILIEFGKEIGNICLNEKAVVARARVENPWFTDKMVTLASENWGNALQKAKVNKWLQEYSYSKEVEKTVGIIMAGNIPFVGLHDLLCAVALGFKANCKLSSSDVPLMKWAIFTLWEIEPKLKTRITIAEEKLDKVDALIATGSDNSARYFEYYFNGTPKIIRRNRSSVAIIDADTNQNDLDCLADDIFQYYGLGCRNVGKVYLPKGYDVVKLIDALHKYKDIIHHHKYANNYTYHKAILLMNLDKHLDSGFLILQEKQDEIKPPLSTLFYSYYDDKNELISKLRVNQSIQCIVGKGKGLIAYGDAQKPGLEDYADNVNTLKFLNQL